MAPTEHVNIATVERDNREPGGYPASGDAAPVNAAPAKLPTRLNTAAYFWSLFALGMVVASIGPSLPRLAGNTGVTLGVIGIVFSAYRGGYLIGSLSGGFALDRLPGNRLIALTLLIMAGAFAVVPVMATLPFLVGIFLLVGVAAGTVEVGSNTLLVWLYGSRVGPWMSALHFTFGIGAILTPFLIAQAIRLTDTLLPAFVVAAILMFPGVAMLLIARSPRPPVTDADDSTSADIVTVVLIAILFLLYIGAESSFGGWIYTWAIQIHRITPAKAAVLTSLFWGTLTAGRLLSIPVATRFTPRAILIGTFVGSTASVALLYSPIGTGSEPVLWIAAAGTGLSMAAVIPTTMSFAGKHMRVTGSISRWFFIGGGAGGMTIPWIIGRLIDGTGPKSVMPGILIVLLCMGFTLALLLLRIARRH